MRLALISEESVERTVTKAPGPDEEVLFVRAQSSRDKLRQAVVRFKVDGMRRTSKRHHSKEKRSCLRGGIFNAQRRVRYSKLQRWW